MRGVVGEEGGRYLTPVLVLGAGLTSAGETPDTSSLSDGEEPAGEGGATEGQEGEGVAGAGAGEAAEGGALPASLPTTANARTAERGVLVARGESLPNALLNMERVLLNLLGFPPGVPPPQGFRGAARTEEEEDEAFFGVAPGEEKNTAETARSSMSLPSLALPSESFPLPHLLEPFRRQDTRRTSVNSGANSLVVLMEPRRRGDRGGSTAGDGGASGDGAIDWLVEEGAVLVLLPGVRGPTDAADCVPRSLFVTFPGWGGWGWGWKEPLPLPLLLLLLPNMLPMVVVVLQVVVMT